MKCPKCSTDSPSGSSFCARCGAPLLGDAETVPTPAGSRTLLGLEPRIRTGVFLIGGIIPNNHLKLAPEADHINFAPRIKIPILMLNGKYDFVFPLETAQKPLFRFLGSPEGRKSHILYDTDHNLPRNEMIKETLNWLDKYLGPVR
jgi:pimeloyl-ACP methyl ester carboxylesterase